MELYVDRTGTGKYVLIDTSPTEDVNLEDRTTYAQEINAVYKAFTSSMALDATPNNIRALGYFGNTELATSPKIKLDAKLYLGGVIFKTGFITIENVSYKNNKPSIFQVSFSDGIKNLTELVGDDLINDLNINTDGTDSLKGDFSWTSANIIGGLGGLMTASGNIPYFIPLVSIDRVFSIDSSAPNTDNIAKSTQTITSDNVLLPSEIRPAMFINDILKRIEDKYGFSMNITPYSASGKQTPLTGLATHCVATDTTTKPIKLKINNQPWNVEDFREERFNIIQRPDVSGFELNYLGYGGGSNHQGTFGMYIDLHKGAGDVKVEGKLVNSLEVWLMDSSGKPTKKLNYAVKLGAEKGSPSIGLNIGLDVFTKPGENQPSTSVKPLICIMASVDNNSGFQNASVWFDWSNVTWIKGMWNIPQSTLPAKANLFEGLAPIKVVDFIKSIYTMFGYKSFTDPSGNVYTVNDFFYKEKIVSDGKNPIKDFSHSSKRVENDLTPFADLSKLTKKPNPFYDGYNLKHKTSSYLANTAYLDQRKIEYGQLKYPIKGSPKSEFLIETKFTSPVFVNIPGNTDQLLTTYYPFKGEPKLNDSETRFVYDTVKDEMPIFYRRGTVTIGTQVAFVNVSTVIGLQKFNVISHRSINILTTKNPLNEITSLFAIADGDLENQNTLYIQGYQNYIEGTLSGGKLLHDLEIQFPNNVEVNKFSNNQEVIIKESRFTVAQSSISLTTGKGKLTLLNM